MNLRPFPTRARPSLIQATYHQLHCTRCNKYLPASQRAYALIRGRRPILYFCDYTCFRRLASSAHARRAAP